MEREKNGNPRRKRKDPQSRDFLCKCGKSYLSYAAAYTHVKNKHHLEKEYVDNIKKPEREQLRRGRPKEKKQNNHTFETALLTLIESAILKICTEVEDVFERPVLEGNQERQQQQFTVSCALLVREKAEQLGQIDLQLDEALGEFQQQLNKDFSCEMACRIRLACILLGQLEDDEDYYLQKMTRVNLWKGKNKINNIILETYKEWKKLIGEPVKKESEPNNNHDYWKEE